MRTRWQTFEEQYLHSITKMKIIKYLTVLLISIKSFSQTKPTIFYNENGKEMTREIFIKSIDYNKNLNLYFENDSIQYGLLVKRRNFGRLDKKTFTKLKAYLTQLSKIKIDSTQNIVVNYITGFTDYKGNTKPRPTWSILQKNYTKELHKIADIVQFWIYPPKSSDNLTYYLQKRNNWIEDKENIFKKLFFPHEIEFGNYILIKPDGKFYYYLGEHSKYGIWDTSKKYFK